MVLGMTPFLFAHVAISLVAIASGLAVLIGMIGNRRMEGLTILFLVSTFATSLTGFGFPIHGPTPALALGAISIAVLAPTILSRYAFGMRGSWRWIYVTGATLALYFNCFVLVVQAFLKVPLLHAISPDGTGLPFAIAQGAVLVFFAGAAILAIRRFRPHYVFASSAINA